MKASVNRAIELWLQRILHCCSRRDERSPCRASRHNSPTACVRADTEQRTVAEPVPPQPAPAAAVHHCPASVLRRAGNLTCLQPRQPAAQQQERLQPQLLTERCHLLPQHGCHSPCPRCQHAVLLRLTHEKRSRMWSAPWTPGQAP